MALGTVWRAVGVVDCKIFTLTTDTSATLTYATGLDVPDVKEVRFKEVGKSSMSMGDAKATALEFIGTHGNGSFSSDALPRAIIAALTGASIVDSGTTPNQIQTIRPKPSNVYPYFKIEAQVARGQGDSNDVHLVIGKCKLNAAPDISPLKGTDGFLAASFSFDFIEMTNAAGIFCDLVANETSTAIVP